MPPDVIGSRWPSWAEIVGASADSDALCSTQPVEDLNPLVAPSSTEIRKAVGAQDAASGNSSDILGGPFIFPGSMTHETTDSRELTHGVKDPGEPASINRGSECAQAQLWKSAWSNTYQWPYFYNCETREVRWDLPPGAKLAPGDGARRSL